MGCVNGYCSSSPNIVISKDKRYTATIVSNALSNQMCSYKTNNKFLSINSARLESENMESSCFQSNHRLSFSNKELKIPDNPLPFVKIKPKKY